MFAFVISLFALCTSSKRILTIHPRAIAGAYNNTPHDCGLNITHSGWTKIL